VVVGGGLSIVCTAGNIKVVEAPVDKALLFTTEGKMEDGSCIDLYVIAAAPIIPGMILQTFPACSSIASFGTPSLQKMVSTVRGVPVKPFLGLSVNLWRKCLHCPCSRKRFSNTCRKKVPSGTVAPHVLRKPVPQLPPVHRCLGDLSVQCLYCQKKFPSLDSYLIECVPDFAP
jgi:hypothetical protein